MDLGMLRGLLYWLTTPGAGGITVWVMDHWKWAKSLSDEPKRWLAFALSGAIALAAWGAQMAMLYVEPPADWRAGVEYAVALVFFAFGISQLAHARMSAARARRAKAAVYRSMALRG